MQYRLLFAIALIYVVFQGRLRSKVSGAQNEVLGRIHTHLFSGL